MKIGDYVRINNGQIAKIVKIKEYKKWLNIIYTDIAIDLHEDRACNDNFINEDEIIKSSPNIIDLIEVGDYVNGEKIIALRKDINERNIHMNSKDNLIFTDYDIANNWYFGIDTDKIETIVTKEQFESMEYKVVE